MNQKKQIVWNPVALVFIAFTTAIGAILGSAWDGLAVGTGLSLLGTIVG